MPPLYVLDLTSQRYHLPSPAVGVSCPQRRRQATHLAFPDRVVTTKTLDAMLAHPDRYPSEVVLAADVAVNIHSLCLPASSMNRGKLAQPV
eukprot:COSAG02_NODE_49_length_45106_cov_298.436177_31_plen_91_part_00